MVVAIVTFPTIARADVSYFYEMSSCIPSEGIVRISLTSVFEEDSPPQGSVLLDGLPQYDTKEQPLAICNLGNKRTISIKGIIDGKHPFSSGVMIYINSRPMQHGISEPSAIEISFDKEDFYVSVKECDLVLNHCVNERITSPSFLCGESNSKVEKMICRTDMLSAQDVKLDQAYKSALSRVADSKTLKYDQLEWLKSRGKTCNVPDWSPSNGVYDTALTCMVKLYRGRIEYLNSRTLH